jgi:hypothetical protein
MAVPGAPTWLGQVLERARFLRTFAPVRRGKKPPLTGSSECHILPPRQHNDVVAESNARKTSLLRYLRFRRVLTASSRVDESACGNVSATFSADRGAMSVGMDADGCFVNRVTAEQLIQGWPCGKEAARHTHPIAPGPSAKSSAPLGHRNYRELFYFLRWHVGRFLATRCENASLDLRAGTGLLWTAWRTAAPSNIHPFAAISFDFPSRTTYMDVGFLQSFRGPVPTQVFLALC